MKNAILLVLFLALVRIGQTQENELSADLDSISAPEKKIKKLKVSGFLQVHYQNPINSNHDDTVAADRIRILRARISFKGDINKYISYDLMIDPRSPQITGLLRDAFIIFRVIPRHQIRVGQQKTLFGYENVESSSRLFVVNRAEMSDALSRGLNLRDIGLGLKGNIKLGKGWRFEDAITLTNGTGLNPPGPDDFNRSKNVFGRIGVRYKKEDFMLRMGASGAVGDILDKGDPLNPTDDIFTKFKRVGVDVEIDHKRFFIAAEYAAGPNTTAIDGTSDNSGYYFTLCGKTSWNVGPLIRYDVLNTDEFRRLTMGAYYGAPNSKFRVLLNYEYRTFVNEEFPNGDDDRLYIQFQVVF